MESSQELLYSVNDGIARITINRPEARNAMSPAVIAGLLGAIRSAAEDASVRVVLLAGAGDKAFCAGADLSNMFDSICLLTSQSINSATLLTTKTTKVLQ